MAHILHDDVEVVAMIVVLDELDNVGMFQAPHDLHLVVDLFVELPGLQETLLLQFLSCKELAIHFGSQLMNSCEGPFTDNACEK